MGRTKANQCFVCMNGVPSRCEWIRTGKNPPPECCPRFERDIMRSKDIASILGITVHTLYNKRPEKVVEQLRAKQIYVRAIKDGRSVIYCKELYQEKNNYGVENPVLPDYLIEEEDIPIEAKRLTVSELLPIINIKSTKTFNAIIDARLVSLLKQRGYELYIKHTNRSRMFFVRRIL